MREGLELPARIKNAPSMPFGLQLYYTAFFELSSCRQASMGVGPISWLAVQDYGLALGLDEDQIEDLHFFVRKLDNEYIRVENTKMKTKIGGSSGGRGGVGRGVRAPN